MSLLEDKLTAVLENRPEPPQGPPICTVRREKDKKKKKPPCGTQMVAVGNPNDPLFVCPKCDQLPGQTNF